MSFNKSDFTDQTCAYHVAYLGESEYVQVEPKGDSDLYNYIAFNLTYGEEYHFMVRGKNQESDEDILGDPVWKTDKIPKCSAIQSNTTYCPPTTENLILKFSSNDGHFLNVTVSWNQTTHEPDFYFLELKDTYNKNDSDGVYNYTIHKVS